MRAHATATLAGGARNQDHHVVGDGFAAVLDGATSVAGDRSHDPGWYAEQLGEALGDALAADPDGRTGEAVARAIAQVRDANGLTPATTPTSTVAVVRWDEERVEAYALGDSIAALIHTDGTETVHTDERLDAVAVAHHRRYLDRLAAGHGYDDEHRAMLIELQAEQARHRNLPGGFWIAGAEPDAAHHGLTTTTDRAGVVGVVLASDGVVLERYASGATWAVLHHDAVAHGPDGVLARVHDAEERDPDGRRWPRAKRHDDKTLVVLA